MGSVINESDKKSAIILAMFSEIKAIFGTTRVQKLIFLYQQEFIQSNYFHYKPHFYGPFSKEVSELLDDLIDTGLIVEKYAKNKSTKEDYTVLELTSKVRNNPSFYNNWINSSERFHIKDVISKYGYLSRNDLLKEAYKYEEFTTRSIIKDDLK